MTRLGDGQSEGVARMESIPKKPGGDGNNNCR